MGASAELLTYVIVMEAIRHVSNDTVVCLLFRLSYYIHMYRRKTFLWVSFLFFLLLVLYYLALHLELLSRSSFYPLSRERLVSRSNEMIDCYSFLIITARLAFFSVCTSTETSISRIASSTIITQA